jgi:hypothetical protein
MDGDDEMGIIPQRPEIAAATDPHVHTSDISVGVEKQATTPASSPAPGMFKIFRSWLVGFVMSDGFRSFRD